MSIETAASNARIEPADLPRHLYPTIPSQVAVINAELEFTGL